VLGFSVARGGLQFILIIWLQAVWLPLHGVRFTEIPLQAGLDLLPMMFGFLLASPLSGWLADRYGAKLLSTSGLLIIALSLCMLATLPADFSLTLFCIYITLTGIGMGLFAAPNSTQLMGSVPAGYRGIAAGMRQTATNTGQLVSAALFFTVVIGGLSAQLPTALSRGLENVGVPTAAAHAAAGLPAGSAVFAALLGYNPLARLLHANALTGVPPDTVHQITGGHFFAGLIAQPLADSMHVAFMIAAAFALAGAIASALRGPRLHEAPLPPVEAPLARPPTVFTEGQL
jgi:MFS family permease